MNMPRGRKKGCKDKVKRKTTMGKAHREEVRTHMIKVIEEAYRNREIIDKNRKSEK